MQLKNSNNIITTTSWNGAIWTNKNYLENTLLEILTQKTHGKQTVKCLLQSINLPCIMMVLISMHHQLGILISKIFYKQEIVHHYNLSFYDIRYNIVPWLLGNYILSFMEIFGFVFFHMITGFLSFQF